MSPRTINILIGLLVASLFVGFVVSLTRQDYDGSIVHTTTNKEAESWSDFLSINFKTIAALNDQVKFEAADFSQGIYLRNNDFKRVQNFSRGVGEDFFHSDKQSQVRFIVRRMDQDGVIIEYESQSISSKRGNAVTLDRGAFKLDWKS